MHENTNYTTILTTVITSPMPHNTSSSYYDSSRDDKISLIVFLSLLGAVFLCTCGLGLCCRSGGPPRSREMEGTEMRTIPARTIPPPPPEAQSASASATAAVPAPPLAPAPVAVKRLSSENESVRSARTEVWVEMQRSESDERLRSGGAEMGNGFMRRSSRQMDGGDLGEGPMKPWSPI